MTTIREYHARNSCEDGCAALVIDAQTGAVLLWTEEMDCGGLDVADGNTSPSVDIAHLDTLSVAVEWVQCADPSILDPGTTLPLRIGGDE